MYHDRVLALGIKVIILHVNEIPYSHGYHDCKGHKARGLQKGFK